MRQPIDYKFVTMTFSRDIKTQIVHAQVANPNSLCVVIDNTQKKNLEVGLLFFKALKKSKFSLCHVRSIVEGFDSPISSKYVTTRRHIYIHQSIHFFLHAPLCII
jgi:hypothetical protein